MALQLNAEDQQLLEDLRSKYAGHAAQQGANNDEESKYASASALTQHTGGSAGRAGKQSDVDVKLCQHCNGTGLIMEEYNHRRLEKFCTSCEGKGVNVYRNGVEVLDASLPSSQQSKSDSSDRESNLREDIAALEHKLATYQQERAQVSAACTGQDPEGDKLRQQLLAQLDLQIGKLTKAKDSKAGMLQREQEQAAVDAPAA